MSRTVNKVTLVGHVGRDPEIRTLDDGTKIVSLSLATTRSERGRDGEERTVTDWHRLVLLHRMAAFTEEYVRKGDRIYVEGRIEYKTYENEGITIPAAEVAVREIVLLTPANGGLEEEVH